MKVMPLRKLRKPYRLTISHQGYVPDTILFKSIDLAFETGEYEMLRLLGKHLHPCDYADFKKNHTFTYGEWEFTVTERKYKED